MTVIIPLGLGTEANHSVCDTDRKLRRMLIVFVMNIKFSSEYKLLVI